MKKGKQLHFFQEILVIKVKQLKKCVPEVLAHTSGQEFSVNKKKKQ